MAVPRVPFAIPTFDCIPTEPHTDGSLTDAPGGWLTNDHDHHHHMGPTPPQSSHTPTELEDVAEGGVVDGEGVVPREGVEEGAAEGRRLPRRDGG